MFPAKFRGMGACRGPESCGRSVTITSCARATGRGFTAARSESHAGTEVHLCGCKFELRKIQKVALLWNILSV